MNKFNLTFFCYDVKKKLISQIDAGDMTTDELHEFGYNDVKAYKPIVLEAVKKEKGKKIAGQVKQIMACYTNIKELKVEIVNEDPILA